MNDHMHDELKNMYCTYCNAEVPANAKQCSKCGLIFQVESHLRQIEPSGHDPEVKVGFCVDCEALRELTPDCAQCAKCQSKSIWKPNAVKEFVRIGLRDIYAEQEKKKP